jgi:Apg6 BARA domain
MNGCGNDKEHSKARMNDSHSPLHMQAASSTPLDTLQHDHETLQSRLESLRRRRRKLGTLQQTCQQQQQLLLERIHARQKSQPIDDLVAVISHRASHRHFLANAKRWNVLNDCFHIWIATNGGSLAIINGCRLGAEAPPLPPDLIVSDRGQRQVSSALLIEPPSLQQQRNGQQQQQQQTTPHSNNLHQEQDSKELATTTTTTSQIVNQNGHSSVNLSDEAPTTNTSPSLQQPRLFFGLFNQPMTSKQQNTPTAPLSSLEPTRVPWLEVNAALGHACLLLKLLQELSSTRESTGTALKFTHELHPMAATSKIGIRFGNKLGIIDTTNTNNSKWKSITPVVYNLYFEEASGFNFFKNNLKNFNFALQALLQCLAEAAAQQSDKTIALPHPIEHWTSKQHYQANSHNVHNFLNGGEWTIGGLSICYPGAETAAGTPNGNNMHSPPPHLHHHHHHRESPTVEWTRACKFLLTDLKWLVAYAAKHVDR